MKEKTLHLVLTHHWFDEILTGRKNVEYRKMSPYWKRLIWEKRHEITHVRFQRGYSKNPKTITFPVFLIHIGECPIDGWNDLYFRIHFGKN